MGDTDKRTEGLGRGRTGTGGLKGRGCVHRGARVGVQEHAGRAVPAVAPYVVPAWRPGTGGGGGAGTRDQWGVFSWIKTCETCSSHLRESGVYFLHMNVDLGAFEKEGRFTKHF